MDAYSIVGPLLRLAPPELAHRVAIRALALGLRPREHADPPVLHTDLWRRSFCNPIGIAAGFDKNGEVADRFPGVGFVEVGTVTPLPQAGNPRPRVFRLPADQAVINRLGFNSEGLEVVRKRLGRRDRKRIVGANLGCNRDAGDRLQDYLTGLRALAPVADYIVLNVSSPNTPGLRDLQARERLGQLLKAVLEARRDLGESADIPVLLKLSPDLTESDLRDVVECAMEHHVDGLVVSNATVARPRQLRDLRKSEVGGLSGRPLFAPSTRLLSQVYRMTGGRVVLVGVGGVASGLDAYAKIKAGASLVQLYTALIYQGPGLIRHIKRELAAALEADGFANVGEAVGTGVA